jgi:pimeloyl-ACP methyl ester carboxylesterase
MAWRLAEQQPDKVIAIVGVAPGPPANLQSILPDDPDAVNALRFDEEAGCPIYSPEDRPVWMPADFIAAYWAGSPRFPRTALEAYAKSIVPESARLLNERFNIGGRGLRVEAPGTVAERPILIVTGEHDPRHPRHVDAKTARFFGADFVWLPDEGIRDNGHMLMIEDNHTQIADLILAWMDRRQLRGSTSSAQGTENSRVT